ncbi:hypothetical protein VNO77_07927 [Canavalia gladiata]|uniref:Uncharacterized protein n=1 Tax=Canavalia gladiata TaxID=3824 RepID=A0AAN9MES5_CANGL
MLSWLTVISARTSMPSRQASYPRENAYHYKAAWLHLMRLKIRGQLFGVSAGYQLAPSLGQWSNTCLYSSRQERTTSNPGGMIEFHVEDGKLVVIWLSLPDGFCHPVFMKYERDSGYPPRVQHATRE